MSAPLIPIVSKATDAGISAADREHAQRVARIKSVEAEMARINRGAGRAQVVATSDGGIPQAIFVPSDPQPAVAAKTETKNVHPRVEAFKAALSANAADLLSFILRADEAYKGTRLLDLNGLAVAQALHIPEKDALEARSELERAGLITFRDDGSGNRGFLPRLP